MLRYNPVPANLVLPYRDNSIQFDFAAIEPAIARQIKYSYFLEHYSKNWSEPSAVSTAGFGNIPPGDYMLKVRAVSSAGREGFVSYTFRIATPWRASWWAWCIYITLATGALYFIYRRRVTSVERKQMLRMQSMVATQEEERNRIARDLHDDIGVKLSRLRLFLSSLYDKSSAIRNTSIQTLADKSQSLVGEAMQDVRRLLLNLGPGVLEEFGYPVAVSTIINKINQTGKIDFTFTSFGFEHRLEKNYELAAYRITQELINNTLKHSGAQKASLQAVLRNGQIILMMEDDGRGFSPDDVAAGQGLHNLQTRTELMGGNIIIDSCPGRGTCITINFPIISDHE